MTEEVIDNPRLIATLLKAEQQIQRILLILNERLMIEWFAQIDSISIEPDFPKPRVTIRTKGLPIC